MDVNRFLLDVGVVTLLIFTLLAATGSITGFLTFEQTALLSIENETGIAVTRFTYDKRILLGNTTPISFEVTNIGSNRLDDVSFKIEVSNTNGSNTWEYFSQERNLQPGDFLGRTFNHVPQTTGIHSVNVEIRFEGQTLQTSDLLFVNARPEPVTRTVTIVRKRIRYVDAEEEEDTPAPSRSWRIRAPRNLTLSQGMTSTAAIGVENTGGADIKNVRLTLQTPENISARYNPKIMFEVRPGETKNFMVGLTPGNKTRGRYTPSYRVTSETFTREGSIDVSVLPTTTIKRLEQEILSLRLMVSDATAQTRQARRRGVDTAAIDKALNRSRQNLQDAERSLEQGKLKAAQASIDAAQASVERAYQQLFSIRGDQISVRAPLIQPVYVLLIASVLIALIMVASYYYMREHENRRPALLREEQ